ncbi:hypothetical protein GPECTOR_17g945 [Gonium pectorale]|uniref:Uncharacterized protein n=1 Tax=Gonium pectorale TaxID=33097 RepID=A0A150GKD6_GONPE|nr:hypothetical protein GPECTOR_17g945 [Gonium pectorale]|eukprot:KXZ50306.1 hypothetical protein GPECTOR_17g945 [Gonium pectorale]
MASTELVVFGDSISDTGNTYNWTSGYIPSPGSYWRGRFSNGPVWLDHLMRMAPSGGGAAAENRLRILNYAFGGSTACPTAGTAIASLDMQITAFLAGVPPAGHAQSISSAATASSISINSSSVTSAADLCAVSAGTGLASSNGTAKKLPSVRFSAGPGGAEPVEPKGRLFVVLIGGNDLLFLRNWKDPRVIERRVANTSACTVAALDRLMAALSSAQPQRLTPFAGRSEQPEAAAEVGSSHDRIVVWNLGAVNRAPVVPPALKATVADAVAAYNRNLEAALAPLRSRYPDGPRLDVYDVHSASECVFRNAERLGFKDATDPCLTDSPYLRAITSMADHSFADAAQDRAASRCTHPNEYMWFDDVHPTSRMHMLGLAAPFARAQGWL